MKTSTLSTLILAVTIALFAQCATAQEAEEGFRAFLGYKSLKLDDHQFTHNTHPDDSFLPNSAVPGSAGSTDVGGTLSFAAFGMGYQFRLWDSFAISLDAGGLAGGKRDSRQNANDSRPPGSASYIYTEARWGTFGAVGFVYYLHRFYFGAEGQLAGVFVQSGWNRFGKDDAEHNTFDLLPSGGPKVGYSFTQDISVEGTVQFGRAVTFGIQGIWKL
jgi:hypothetical protein